MLVIIVAAFHICPHCIPTQTHVLALIHILVCPDLYNDFFKEFMMCLNVYYPQIH